MIDKSHLRFRWPELLGELLRTALLMPHAEKMQRRIQPAEIRQRHLSGGIAFQIVAIDWSSRLPAEAHFVQLFSANTREIQARLNRFLRKARVMLHSADALFRHRKKELAIAGDAGRRIMHLRIVNPQRDHALPRSFLRTNTSESTSSMIAHGDEFSPRKARSTKRTGPYPGEVHPPWKRRASWNAMIPFSITYGCQSFQSCSTASSL